eukprot:scaffold301_cov243-Pinguiococcus_pyrenoidosus.AAC.88
MPKLGLTVPTVPIVPKSRSPEVLKSRSPEVLEEPGSLGEAWEKKLGRKTRETRSAHPRTRPESSFGRSRDKRGKQNKTRRQHPLKHPLFFPLPSFMALRLPPSAIFAPLPRPYWHFGTRRHHPSCLHRQSSRALGTIVCRWVCRRTPLSVVLWRESPPSRRRLLISTFIKN